jgi:hypothetical protein
MDDDVTQLHRLVLAATAINYAVLALQDHYFIIVVHPATISLFFFFC